MATESPWDTAARELARARRRAEPVRPGARRSRPATSPPLRLVGASAAPVPGSAAQVAPRAGAPRTQPAITDATDPRWVLAIRTADQLQGSILAPERREKLIRLGRTMGLSVFDANLVIAIVQDQARRGFRPEECPARAEAQLRMIPLPEAPGIWGHLRQNPSRIAALVAAILGLEILLLMLWFGS